MTTLEKNPQGFLCEQLELFWENTLSFGVCSWEMFEHFLGWAVGQWLALSPLVRLSSGLCTCQSSFSTSNLLLHVSMDFLWDLLCSHVGTWMNCCHKVFRGWNCPTHPGMVRTYSQTINLTPPTAKSRLIHQIHIWRSVVPHSRDHISYFPVQIVMFITSLHPKFCVALCDV